jgi:AbrB family looped-hinge helix DNA binding protein
VAVGRAEKPNNVTITGRGQVSLPARGMRALGWRPGDHLLVERVGDALVLIRRPDDWADEVAGSFSHLFGTTEENVAFVRGERASWEE